MEGPDLPLLTRERPGVLRYGGARMALLDIEHGFWGLRCQLEVLVGPRLAGAVLQQAGAAGAAAFAGEFAAGVTPQTSGQALRDCVAAYGAAGFGAFEVDLTGWEGGRARVIGRDTFEAWAAARRGRGTDTAVCAYTASVLAGFANVVAGRRDLVGLERACRAQGAETCAFALLPAAAGEVGAATLTPDPYLGHQFGLLELLFDRMSSPMPTSACGRRLSCGRRSSSTGACLRPPATGW
jgi:hypothetical protein